MALHEASRKRTASHGAPGCLSRRGIPVPVFPLCAEPRESAGAGVRESTGPGQVLLRPYSPLKGRREEVFGPGRAVPLDHNAKARIAAYARAWERPATSKPRQHKRNRSPETFLEVLEGAPVGASVNKPDPGAASRPTRRSPPRAECYPQHGSGGPEGAGVGRRADLAEPHHPWAVVRQQRPVRPLMKPALDGRSAPGQRLRISGH